jgi:hypothetical protein
MSPKAFVVPVTTHTWPSKSYGGVQTVPSRRVDVPFEFNRLVFAQKLKMNSQMLLTTVCTGETSSDHNVKPRSFIKTQSIHYILFVVHDSASTPYNVS